jgi:hypothetical protein
MAGSQTTIRCAKSIAGAALIGLGVVLLYENLSGAIVRLRLVLGANGSEALGVLLVLMHGASQILHAYTANHQQFQKDFLQHVLISSWPLLLVIVGTVLSWDSTADSVSAPPRNDAELVELSAGGSTLK